MYMRPTPEMWASYDIDRKRRYLAETLTMLEESDLDAIEKEVHKRLDKARRQRIKEDKRRMRQHKSW